MHENPLGFSSGVARFVRTGSRLRSGLFLVDVYLVGCATAERGAQSDGIVERQIAAGAGERFLYCLCARLGTERDRPLPRESPGWTFDAARLHTPPRSRMVGVMAFTRKHVVSSVFDR